MKTQISDYSQKGMADVKALMKIKNINVQTLADFVGISKRTLYRWLDSPTDDKQKTILLQSIEAMEQGYKRKGFFIFKGETE